MKELIEIQLYHYKTESLLSKPIVIALHILHYKILKYVKYSLITLNNIISFIAILIINYYVVYRTQ